MTNHFLNRAARTANLSNSHRRAKKQEKEIAKKIGGNLTPASGAGQIKGDVRLKNIARIECKTTKNKSFSVTLEMLRKIEDAAAMAGELPIIVVEFSDGYGKKIAECAVCPTYVLDSLRG